MADQRRSNFHAVFTMSLCALELKQTLIIFFEKLTCEHEFHTLPNTKVSTAKDHGEYYMKVRPPLVRHLLRNSLFSQDDDFWTVFRLVKSIYVKELTTDIKAMKRMKEYLT